MPSIGVDVLDLFWCGGKCAGDEIQIISGTINAQLDNISLMSANGDVVSSDAALQLDESEAKSGQIRNVRQLWLCDVGGFDAPVVLFRWVGVML